MLTHTDNESTITALLLAAGSSSRMGQSKQLLPVKGVPLLRKTVLTALAANINRLVVVLGHEGKQHEVVLNDLDIDIVHHAGWEKGIGSSIKAGTLHILKKHESTQALLIMVCDQPHITTNHLNNLIDEYRTPEAPIIASKYAQTTGVPVIFDKTVFPEILNLEDGQGAKKILNAHKNELLSIDFPKGEIDIDTPDDYEKHLC
ncbi:MAG: nucleotidyltransferase family protein [Cyclobacteriaceae bacterium]|nr:nucleotidyltransferase family protein [Cyclobacteriaceae bacterium]